MHEKPPMPPAAPKKPKKELKAELSIEEMSIDQLNARIEALTREIERFGEIEKAIVQKKEKAKEGEEGLSIEEGMMEHDPSFAKKDTSSRTSRTRSREKGEVSGREVEIQAAKLINERAELIIRRDKLSKKKDEGLT